MEVSLLLSRPHSPPVLPAHLSSGKRLSSVLNFYSPQLALFSKLFLKLLKYPFCVISVTRSGSFLTDECLRPSLRLWTSGALSCPQVLALPSYRCRGTVPRFCTEEALLGSGQKLGLLGSAYLWVLSGVAPAQGAEGLPVQGALSHPCRCPLSPTRLWGHGLPAFPWNLPFLGSGAGRLPLFLCVAGS